MGDMETWHSSTTSLTTSNPSKDLGRQMRWDYIRWPSLAGLVLYAELLCYEAGMQVARVTRPCVYAHVRYMHSLHTLAGPEIYA